MTELERAWVTAIRAFGNGKDRAYVGKLLRAMQFDDDTIEELIAGAINALNEYDDMEIAAVSPMPEALEKIASARIEAAEQAVEDIKQERIARGRKRAEEILKREAVQQTGKPLSADLLHESMQDVEEDRWVIDGLLPTDGRMLIGGFRKAGKSIVALNMAVALAGGTDFLGMPTMRRDVCWLNLELTQNMARSWARDLSTWVDPEVLARIYAVHLRGAVSHMIPTDDRGRDALIAAIRPTGARTLFVDPVAPLMAGSGLDSHSEMDVGKFLVAMDEVAAEAGISEIVYVAHVGKASSRDEGNETVSGSIRWEAAVDSIFIVGRVGEGDIRWIRAEGRDVSIDDVTLQYEADTKKVELVAASRRDLLMEQRAVEVREVVESSPGINSGELSGDSRIHGTKGDRLAAMRLAVERCWVRIQPGPNNSKTYWPNA